MTFLIGLVLEYTRTCIWFNCNAQCDVVYNNDIQEENACVICVQNLDVYKNIKVLANYHLLMISNLKTISNYLQTKNIYIFSRRPHFNLLVDEQMKQPISSSNPQ